MQLNPILTNVTVTRLSRHCLRLPFKIVFKKLAWWPACNTSAKTATTCKSRWTSSTTRYVILIGRLSSDQSISQVLVKNKLNLKCRGFLISFQVRGLFGNFHAGTTYKVQSKGKHGKVHQNGESAVVTIRNEDSSEGMVRYIFHQKSTYFLLCLSVTKMSLIL